MPFLRKTIGSKIFKRVLTTWILVALLSTQIFQIDLSQSSAQQEHYSVVAILVDDAIYSDPTDYVGLSDEYASLPSTTLKARIDRYAELVQSVMPMTKALIIRTISDEKPENIMQALQTLYFEGDGSGDAYTQLSGVVLIGNLPLPVVNKNGNRYLSLYPYTDFEDPAYLFNSSTNDFEPSPQVENPQPEVWHGVIRSPISGIEGNELLASYLDKNYLYRQGNEDFSIFDQKLFYGDTIAEKNALNDTVLDAYQRFLDNFENIAYYRYTSDLARELYEEVYGSVNGGDGIDNDEDDLIDEDPANGYDDDNDGLIDEDDGNFNYGIDNDRDCWAQSSRDWDSNGDGRPCYVGDNLVDEDDTDDNNNDGDLLTNEDEKGDFNGDGCPGTCDTDDDGDQADWDGDGWPNGYEDEVLDSNKSKKRSPFWYKAKRLDESDQNYLERMYTDEEYPTYDPLCWSPYDSDETPEPSDYFDGTLLFKPNNTDRNGDICRSSVCETDMSNDDDEDGKCDEDTSDDNDADGDGSTDEDMAGDPDSGGDMFEELPDIQSKSVIDSFFKKYPAIFQKLIGNSTDWTNYTGRYQASYTNSSGVAASDRDTFVGLIGVRDEYVLKVLRAVNDLVESKIDDVVNSVANDFPMIGRATISGEVETTDGTNNFEYTFFNHSVKNRTTAADTIYIYGQTADEISSVGECSLYRGSYDEGGENKLVMGLRVYDYGTAGAWGEENDDGYKEGEDYGGCYGSFADTPEYCFPEIAEVGVRSRTGTIDAQDDSVYVDYRSCYNFKEAVGLLGDGSIVMGLWASTAAVGFGDQGYLYYAEHFLDDYNDLLEDLDDGDKDESDDQDGDGDYDEDDFAIEVQEIKDDLNDDGAYDVPIKDVDDIYLYGEEGDDIYLTVGAVFNYLGVDKDSQEEIGGFFSDDVTSYTLDDWDSFGLDDIESVTFDVEKEYIKADSSFLSSNLTEDESEALTVSSVLKHVEPTVATINQQVEAGYSQALPIDNPRFITFQDQNYDYQRIDYPNIFEASSYDKFEALLRATEKEVVATIPGASVYPGFLTNLLGAEIFEDQLNDVFEWESLNIDQKHLWVLKNYLNPDAITYIGKAEDGYESFYFVADGEANTLNMSFNSNAVGEDPDVEFSGAGAGADESETDDTEEEDYDVNDPDSGHTSWFPFVWMYDILEWLKTLSPAIGATSPSTFSDTSEEEKKSEEKYGCLGQQIYCGSESEDTEIDSDSDGISDEEDIAPYSMDDDDDGIPDGASTTVALSLSSDVDEVLYANGSTLVELTVIALDSNGNLNTNDNFSNVELEIVSGEDSVQILSVDGATLMDGEATLLIATTTTAGAFSMRAVGVSDNVEDVYSNSLTFASKTRRLDLATYEKKYVSEDTVYTTETLEDVLIMDADGSLVATVHADNGEITIVDPLYSLEARFATAELPTREVLVKDGVILASFYLIPDTKQVVIEPSLAGLEGTVNDVRVIDSNASDDWTLQTREDATGGAEALEILYQGQKVGLVLLNGPVYAKPGFSVSLEPGATLTEVTNPHMHITFNVGENILFDVVIGSETNTLEMKGLEEEEKISQMFLKEPSSPLNNLSNHFLTTLKTFFVDIAQAASDFLDSDGDMLDDLSEWTIGSDFTNTDTDGDGYTDDEELNNGYNPLGEGALFTDLPATHEAYSAVLNLYLRGIVSGYEDGSFKPDQSISREEFTKLNLGVVCADCSNYSDTAKAAIEEQYSQNPFPDTDIDPTLYYCVADSRNRGLISGYKGGAYAGYYLPKNSISRAEATKILLKTAGIDFVETAESYLPWYFYAVVKAQANALYPQGRFTALDSYSNINFQKWLETELTYDSDIKAWLEAPITRGEFAMMVDTALQKEDCRLNDVDGDGLSDNAELYNFGTNPYNADTDFGGVDDLTEILNGTNVASDPSDDYGGTGGEDSGDQGDQDDFSADSDQDGLTDAEEAANGTDPFKEDSDNGGVSDFEEIARGTDPLSAEDDLFSETTGTTESLAGAYVSGDYLSRDSVYEMQTLTDSNLIEENVFTKLVPADGTSQLFLRATIVDENGELITDDNTSIVEFSAIDPAYPYAEILRTSIRVTDGVAETELKASTTSGYFVITARITPEELPVMPATVYVYPGDPASVTLESDSSYLKSGGLNTAQVTLTFYDSYYNIASMAPQNVTLTLDGPGSFESGLDEDLEQEGTQVTVFEGIASFFVISGDEEGVANVQVTLNDLKTSLDIGVYEDIQLSLSSANETLNADGVSITTLLVAAMLGDSDTPLSEFNGNVTFALLDDAYGALPETSTISLENGQAQIDFTAGTLAGTAYITASMVGLEPASLPLTLLPGATTTIELSSDLATISTGGEATVYIKAYDEYGNFASNDSSTEVSLRLTDQSASFGSLNNDSITLENGQGQFNVEAGDLTGPINIMVTAYNAESATLTLESVMAVDSGAITDIEPNVLFAALLGAGFGEVTQENFLGGWFTFEGKTEASLSLLSDPLPNARLANIDAQGKLSILDGNTVSISVRPSNSKTLPTQFFVKDLLFEQTILEGAVIPSSTDFYLVDSEYDLSFAKDDGFYIQSLLTDSRYELRESQNPISSGSSIGSGGSSVSLLENQNEIVRFNPDGRVQVYDANYQLTLNENYDSFAFDVTLAGAPLLTVLWEQTFTENVIALDDDFDWDQASLLDPGVYYKGIQSETYGFATAYSGNSSANPKGVFVTNKTQELPSNQKPGLGFTSVEAAGTTPGIGFTGDNKFMLFLSDGQTVGEANLYYASDIGVVLGDPTVRLTDANPLDISSTGFTSGIGRLILVGPETIQDLSVMDYNSDGLQDALVAFENGEIQILENTNAYPRFRNRGDLLNISNGIVDMTQGDFNNDGQTDLVIATTDACIQGEVCIYLYTNNEAQFVRQNLDFDIDGNTIKQIVAEDLNLDEYPDLLISDINGSIVAFYNREGTFLTNGDVIGNVGLQVDSDQDLIGEVLVHYTDMPADDPDSVADDGNFKELPTLVADSSDDASQSYASNLEDLFSNVTSDSTFQAGGFSPNYLADTLEDLTTSDTIQVSMAEPEVTSNESYIYANEDENFATSTKTASDVNGGIVQDRDIIEYHITLANSGSSTISDLAMSDGVSSMLDLDFDSFECDGSCPNMEVSETGVSNYPFTVNGLSLGAGESLTLIYQGTMNGVSAPGVNIFTGQDLDSGFPNDDYVDIGASPEGNPSGQVIYFYSNGTYREDLIDKVNFTKQTSTAEETPSFDDTFKDLGIDLGDVDENGNPKALQLDDDAEEPPKAIDDIYKDATTSSNDELNSLWSTLFTPIENPGDILTNAATGILLADAAISELADTMESLMGMTCSGGCVASPINYAFLVPGPINVLGVPVSPMDPLHIPVFAAPVPSIIPIWPPSPIWQASTAVRIYASVTLTLGTTISVCVGPYLLGRCWSVALPLFEMLGVCDAVNGAISDAISSASAFISNGKNKLLSLGGEGGQSSSSEHSSGGGLVNYNLGSYIVSSGGTTREMVKGFPAPFTEWLRKQGNEIITKLTDFPDIYVYYPDPKSFLTAVIPDTDMIKDADVRGLNKVFSFLNSFPLLRIETQEVVFKFPALTNEEIEKLKLEWSMWLETEKKQWEGVADHWADSQYDEIRAEIEKVFKNVEKNIEILENYKDFPRELLTWRNAQAFYAKQIICYLDALIRYFGGWVATNQQRIEQWIAAVHDVIAALDSWKLLFQLSLDYQESCDQCKNQRLSLFELLAKLFVSIPEPPIIQFPKWPDIVIDFSQIQAGITIVWPDLKFTPEPLKLPPIPVFVFPELPTFDLDLPEIPLLPALPSLPSLPTLPGLSLPDLPDLPPPPEIPGLSATISAMLKISSSILKIICLIHSGILGTQETSLKTQIEDMTQRPLDPILPIDLSITFPSIPIARDLVDFIEIVGVFNLEKGMNFDQLVEMVQAAADVSNDIVTDLVDVANKAMEETSGAVQGASDAATDAVNDVTDIEVEVDLDGSDESSFNDEITPYLNDPFLEPLLSQWNQAVASYTQEAEIQNQASAEVPDAYVMHAASSPIAFTEDEVNSQFESLQNKYYAGTLSVSEDVPLSFLRNDFLAYFNAEEQKTDLLAAHLNQSPDKELDTMIAWMNFDSPSSFTPSSTFLASSTTEEDGSTNTLYSTEAVFEEKRQELLNDFDASTVLGNYLADSSEDDASSTSYADSRVAPQIVDKGLFLYNEDTGVNELLIDYTAEADQPSKLAFLDMENDGDDDILYSYGGNVYLKENYIETEEPTYYEEDPQITSLDDWVPALPTVSLFRATDSNNNEAAIAWKKLDLLNDETLLGYEARSYLALTDFENSEPEQTYWDVFLPTDTPRTASLSDLTLDGSVTISGSSYTSDDVTDGTLSASSLTIGGLLRTEENASMTLSYQDSYGDEAMFTINESTRFPVPSVESGAFFLQNIEGDAALAKDSLERTVVNDSGETSITPGDQIHALDNASFTLTPAEGGSIEISLASNLLITVPTLYPDELTLRVNDGALEVIRQTTFDESQPLYEGMLLLPEEQIVSTEGFTIAYTSSDVSTEDDDGVISMFYSHPSQWTAHSLSGSESPTFNLALENGNYYSVMRALTSTGAFGLFGETALLSPQVCGDEEAPYANVGSVEEEVSVFKTITLDGSDSFDSQSEIIEYYWDLDTTHDSDGDADPANDADYYNDIDPLTDFDGDGSNTNDRDDPTYTAGPYDSVETHDFKLWIKDEAGNSSGAEVAVTVYVPTISLSAAVGTTGTVEGSVDPVVSELPFVLARERDGVFELITTPSVDSNGLYYTDENGEFTIDDLSLSDAWILYNAEQEAIAEVNLATGAISILAHGYSVEVYSAELPWPTRAALVDEDKNPLLYIFIVPDANVDVQIDDSTTKYTADSVAGMVGVHVKDTGLPEGYSLESIPANSPLFTGGVMVKNSEEERVAVIATDGNIYRLDSSLELGVSDISSVNENADETGAEPIVITLNSTQSQDEWLQIYISPEDYSKVTTIEALGLEDEAVNPLNSQDLSALDIDEDGIPDLEELRNGLNPYDAADADADTDGDGLSNLTEYDLGTNLNEADSDEDGQTDSQEVEDGTDPLDPLDSYFEDISSSDPMYEDILHLVELGAIEGYDTEYGHYFKPDQFIARAEYTKVMLAILCISPRAEAYLAPSVFYDIPYSETDLAWYYAITKESYLQGFIVGYLGEKNAEGMTPFKPNISISRAEGTKIILEVLEALEVIDMGEISIPTDSAWYLPYMRIAQDLTPYLLTETTLGQGAPFIITNEEAGYATEALTRYEFMEMAVRVLNFHNCYATQDSDGDGLSDYAEVNVYDTDPNEADTDGGGILDGEEITAGDNPLDRNDDDSDGDSLADADETNLYNTDPNESDTDGGGTYDGVELLQGTDPVDNPEDDAEIGAGAGIFDEQSIEETILEEENVLDGLDSGIYVVTYECTSCPCPTSLENTADLDKGDALYAAIMNTDKTEVLSISQGVEIQDLLGN